MRSREGPGTETSCDDADDPHLKSAASTKQEETSVPEIRQS